MKSINQILNESFDQILNESFQSGIISRIYNGKNAAGKEFINGLNKYGIALNEISDKDVVKVNTVFTSDGKLDHQAYHASLGQARGLIRDSRDVKDYNSPEYSNPKKLGYRYDTDIILMSENGLEGRIRKGGRKSDEVFEATPAVKKLAKSGRQSYDLVYDILNANPTWEVYVIAEKMVTKSNVNSAFEKSQKSANDPSINLGPQRPTDKARYKYVSDLFSSFKDVIADIGTEDIEFRTSASRYSIMSVRFRLNSYRDDAKFVPEKTEFSFSSNNFTLDDEQSLSDLKLRYELVAFIKKNIDTILKRMSTVRERQSQKYKLDKQS